MRRTLFILLAILLLVTSPVSASRLVDYTLTSDHETVPCLRDLPAPRNHLMHGSIRSFMSLSCSTLFL